MSSSSSPTEAMNAQAQTLLDIRNELEELAAELKLLAERSDPTRDWPAPPRPRRGSDEAVVQASGPPPIAPQEVLRQWTSKGTTWLNGLSRRELRGAVQALSVPDVRHTLLSDLAFVAALEKRLRGIRRDLLLAMTLFMVFPPGYGEWRFVVASYGSGPSPAWWREVMAKVEAPEQSLRVWAALALDGELARSGDFDLPAVFWDGPWPREIARAAKLAGIDEARRLLQFADGGALRRHEMPNAAVVQSIRRIAEAVKRRRVPQPLAAQLICQRLGNPLDARFSNQWSELGDLKATVRGWLAGEVLDILFQHLVPRDPERRHMTKPRREFWRHYTSSVSRIWLLVPSRMRSHLDHSDMRRLREVMASSMEVRGLRGQSEQCIVWMHLEGPRGTVTAIEGNASTSLRIAPGSFEPRRDPVQYSEHIVHGPLNEDRNPRSAAFVHDSRGRWMTGAAGTLRQLGIRRQR